MEECERERERDKQTLNGSSVIKDESVAIKTKRVKPEIESR